MLPKKFRLTVPQFTLNKRPYTTIPSPFFTLLIKLSSQKNPRFTIVVPKSLDKRSTKRNRTKRIISAVLLSNLSAVTGDKDVLIKAKKIITEDIETKANRELLELLRRAGLMIQ